MMDKAALNECLSAFSKKIFFCGTANGETPTVYVTDNATRKDVIALLKKKSLQNLNVKTTATMRIAKARSLEDMLVNIPHQPILFDPTATIERASILVDIVKQARQHIGATLKGCYFNSEKRNIHFLLQEETNLNLPAIRDVLEPILLSNTQRLTKPFPYTITLSTQQPLGSVIAIDRLSIVKTSLSNVIKKTLKKLHLPLLVASASTGLGMSAAKADSLPAVSNVNGWVGASVGGFRDQNSGGGFGALGDIGAAIPLNHDIGAQGHAFDGSLAHSNIQSLEGWVFWRDPSMGLVGPHVWYNSYSNVYETLYGLHGEAYINNLTVALEGGGVHQNTNGATYYGEATVSWYAVPDLKIEAGYLHLSNTNLGQISTEYQLGLSSLPGLSIFADVGAGSTDLRYAFLGFNYYFAKAKPLINRQREDMVPPSDLFLTRQKVQKVAPPFHS